MVMGEAGRALRLSTPAVGSDSAGPSDVELLRLAAVDLATANSRRILAEIVARWIHRSLGVSGAEVRLILPNRSGALRAIPAGPVPVGFEDVRAARLTAFTVGAPIRTEQGMPPLTLAIFPIRRGDRIAGLLEVVAETRLVEEKWALLDTLSSMLAPTLSAWRGGNGSVALSVRKLNRLSERSDLLKRLDLGAAWAAHEMKTPLTVARASLDFVLESDPPSGDVAKEVLDRARGHLTSLSQTIDLVLEWIRGTDASRRERFDLSEVAHEVAMVEGRGLNGRLTVDAPSPVPMRGIPVLLKGAVSNLVRNAVTYSPPEGRVTVAVQRIEGTAVVHVDDDGPGVLADEREAIFAPLFRGDAGKRSESGSGLGLFIARQAVEAHGGRIWVTSNGPGSSFRFAIPLRVGRRPSAS
jgi:signal transduction histidine kinase